MVSQGLLLIVSLQTQWNQVMTKISCFRVLEIMYLKKEMPKIIKKNIHIKACIQIKYQELNPESNQSSGFQEVCGGKLVMQYHSLSFLKLSS